MHRASRTAVLLVLAATLWATVVGHGGHSHPSAEQDDRGILQDCRDSPPCRTATGLIGYDWFGTGATGMVPGIAFWILVTAGAVRLVRHRLNR
jgi:hypothetical protein